MPSPDLYADPYRVERIEECAFYHVMDVPGHGVVGSGWDLRGGEKVAMSTRAGEFVTLKQLVDEVGVDAARYFYVMRRADQHLEFDLDLATAARLNYGLQASVVWSRDQNPIIESLWL